MWVVHGKKTCVESDLKGIRLFQIRGTILMNTIKSKTALNLTLLGLQGLEFPGLFSDAN